MGPAGASGPAWTRQTVMGLLLLLLVSCIWVAASFVVQDVQTEGVHPVVLTFLCNSLFSLYLPVAWLGSCLLSLLQAARRHASKGQGVFSTRLGQALANWLGPPAPSIPSSPVASTPPSPDPALWRAALLIAPIWYLAQLTFNASLHLTSVTSNTLLSSSSVLFTYALSVFFLHEPFTPQRLLCILTILAGTAAVTLADARSAPGPGPQPEGLRRAAGDALCILSAALYGSYTALLRALLGDDSGTDTARFFGRMGCVVLGGVGFFIAVTLALGHPLGSLTRHALGLIFAKGFADNVLADYLWARSVLLLGATLGTAGLSMQVPLAVTLDAILGSPPWLARLSTAAWTFGGGAAVLAGFFGMTLRPTEDAVARAGLEGREADPEDRTLLLGTT